MSDTLELYYAHMESDRNKAADAYFSVRPEFNCNDDITKQCRRMFNEGFERAYKLLWKPERDGAEHANR